MEHRTVQLTISEEKTAALKDRFAALVKTIEDRKFVTHKDIEPLAGVLTETVAELPELTDVLKAAHESGAHFLLSLAHHDPELLNLPWGVARDPHSGRRLDEVEQVCLTRELLAEPDAPFPGAVCFPAPLPFRILVMVSSPDDATYQSRLSYEDEEKAILHAFEPLLKSGSVEIHFTNNGSEEELRRKIRENQYHALHFSGHGAFKDGCGYLQLEDEYSLKAKAVTGKDFAKSLLREDGYRIPLVVLSACQTAAGSVEKGFHSVCQELFQHGFPTAVAMSMSVRDTCATQFAGAFYAGVSNGDAVHRAFRDACAAVRRMEEAEFQKAGAVGLAPFQHLIPTLYTRTAETCLSDPDATAETRKTDSHQYVLKNSRFHKNVPDFTFIGRRREKSDLLRPLFEHQAVMLRGMGGVGKTALAVHLAQRYIARHPETEPFFFNEESKSADDVLRALKKHLVKSGEKLKDFKDELELFDTGVEQVGFLAERILDSHDRIPLFIFDNLETFQAEKGGPFRPEHTDMAELIGALAGNDRFPVILTGRYDAALENVGRVRDLNQIGITDFWKKCMELELVGIRENVRRLAGDFPKQALTFYNVVEILHKAFGGNFRALEFFNKIYRTQPDEVAGTLKELAALPEKYEKETLIRMGENLVFGELADSLSQTGQEVLFLLAHFGIPVQQMALELQYHAAGQDVPEGMIEELKALQNLTLIEVSRNTEDRADWEPYFYVTPIIKGLLRLGDEEAVLKGARERVAFSHSSAGEYYYALIQNEVAAGLTERAEAFEHFYQAGDREKVQEIGKTLAGYYYKSSFYQNALEYCMKAEEVCGEETWGWFLNEAGLILDMFGQYDTALNYYQRTLKIAQTDGDRSGEGITLNNISQIYSARGDYDTALKYLSDSLKIAQEIGDQRNEGAMLNNISQIYDARGDYDTALKYLKDSLRIRQEIGDRSGEGTTLSNMGSLAYSKGDYDTALKYLSDSLTIRQEIGDRSGEGTTLNNISQIFKARGDYDTALKYLSDSLTIRQEIGDRSGEGTTLSNMGSLAYSKGDYDTALKYLSDSLTIQKEIGDRSGMCATLFNMGHIHWTNDEKGKARQTWLKVYCIAKQIGEAQALSALDNLAKQLGGSGLDFWKELAQKMPDPDSQE